MQRSKIKNQNNVSFPRRRESRFIVRTKRELFSHHSSFIIHHSNRGQALVTLLIFMVIAVTVTAAAVSLVIINSVSTSKTQQASVVYSVAESGAENGILRLLRNPFYTGETLPVGDGTAVITVTGTNPKIIRSTGTIGNFKRTIEIQVGLTNNIMTIQSWKEIP